MNLLENKNSEFVDIYNRNVQTVYRVCYIYMKNKADAEDMTQNTFAKYLRYKPIFDNITHEKSWFIVASSNLCKNHFKSWYNRNIIQGETNNASTYDSDDTTLQTVLELPVKYKQIIYLYYYEGYSTVEIAKLLNKNESTIRSQLSKGRKLLKDILGSDNL